MWSRCSQNKKNGILLFWVGMIGIFWWSMREGAQPLTMMWSVTHCFFTMLFLLGYLHLSDGTDFYLWFWRLRPAIPVCLSSCLVNSLSSCNGPVDVDKNKPSATSLGMILQDHGQWLLLWCFVFLPWQTSLITKYKRHNDWDCLNCACSPRSNFSEAKNQPKLELSV